MGKGSQAWGITNPLCFGVHSATQVGKRRFGRNLRSSPADGRSLLGGIPERRGNTGHPTSQTAFTLGDSSAGSQTPPLSTDLGFACPPRGWVYGPLIGVLRFGSSELYISLPALGLLNIWARGNYRKQTKRCIRPRADYLTEGFDSRRHRLAKAESVTGSFIGTKGERAALSSPSGKVTLVGSTSRPRKAFQSPEDVFRYYLPRFLRADPFLKTPDSWQQNQGQWTRYFAGRKLGLEEVRGQTGNPVQK